MHRPRVTVKCFGSPARITLACLLATVVFFASIMTWGQDQSVSNTAALQGFVKDSAGHPVAGATVYLQPKDGSLAQSVKADGVGKYGFSGIRDGIYMLRVEMAGFNPAALGPCVIVSGESKTLDLILESPKKIPAQPSSPPSAKAGSGSPEFFDEPQFTVAGVTDGTNLGG